MTCTTCGATLESTATTCPVCGAPVAPAAGGVGAPPAGAAPPSWSAPAWGTPQPHPSGLSGEVRGWGIGSHLAGLGLGLVSAATLAFLGPLVIWLVKRDDHRFIDHHAKESLNFQLTVLLVLVSSILLTIPVVVIGVLTLGLALIPIGLLAVAAVIAWFVLPIIAAVKASNGEGYRYPLTIRFVR